MTVPAEQEPNVLKTVGGLVRPIRHITPGTIYVGAENSQNSEEALALMISHAVRIKELADPEALAGHYNNTFSNNRTRQRYGLPSKTWKICAIKLAKRYFERQGLATDPPNESFRLIQVGITTISSQLLTVRSNPPPEMDDYALFRRKVGEIPPENGLGDYTPAVSICPAAGIARKWYETARVVIIRDLEERYPRRIQIPTPETSVTQIFWLILIFLCCINNS